MSGVSTVLGAGNDSWPSGSDNNALNDTIDGQAGDDTIDGGAGSDTLKFTMSAGTYAPEVSNVEKATMVALCP